jgi:hypothetical protein
MAEQQFNPLLNDRLNTINNGLPPGLVSPRIGASHRTGSTNNSCYLLSHPHIFCILKLSISTTKSSHFFNRHELLILKTPDHFFYIIYINAAQLWRITHFLDTVQLLITPLICSPEHFGAHRGAAVK